MVIFRLQGLGRLLHQGPGRRGLCPDLADQRDVADGREGEGPTGWTRKSGSGWVTRCLKPSRKPRT